MGQFVTAIVLGIKMDDALTKRLTPTDGYDPDFDDPLEDICNHFYRTNVRLETGENRDCLGFSIAVSSGGDDGEESIESTFGLEEIPVIYPERSKWAWEQWEKLSAWCKENRNGLELGHPTLLITYTERA